MARHSETALSRAAAHEQSSPSKPPKPRYGVLLLPSIAVLLAFFVAPMTVMLGYSFRQFDGPAQVGPITYVIDNYVNFFTSLFDWEVLGRTLFISAMVATVAVTIGYPIAYTLARSKSRWKTLLIVIAVLPLITNLVVRNYGWMVILSENGLLNAVLSA